MADKEPNQNNNYYLVGGPLIVNTKNKSVEMPPKNSRNCKKATEALKDGLWMTIKATDNVVIKNKYGEVVTRTDGKGKVLTTREKRRSTRSSSNNVAKGQSNSSYDRG